MAPAVDLRAFLDRVRRERRVDLLEIEHQVDPRFQTTAILMKLEEKQRSPILFFKHVKGSAFPLVTNVCGSMGRLALALDCPLRLVNECYAERVDRRAPPELIAHGPVRENVLTGAEVDLGLLPRLIYHQADSDNPYITAAIVVARDPETGRTNLSYHRLMIAGRARTGILMERGKHLDRIYRKYVGLGRPMPIAVFIGVHPLVSLGALFAGPADVEELDVIGGLMGAPLPVVRAIRQPDLVVPAYAEMALEGTVAIDDAIDEGPFGEFTGYGTGVTRTPVFNVDAMTFRDGCIHQDIVSGHMEHLTLPLPAIQRRTLADARAVAPGVTRVSLPAPFTVLVALEKTDDAQPRAIIQALVRADIYAKHVIVVDADVDVGDPRKVLGAMGLQTQATTGVHLFPDEQGTPLDPSCPSPEGRSAKMGIDATRPLNPRRTVTRNALPASVLDGVDLTAILGTG